MSSSIAAAIPPAMRKPFLCRTKKLPAFLLPSAARFAAFAVVSNVLRDKLSVPLSQSRFVSFRFPPVISPERSEGKRISITKISIIILSIIRS